MLGNPCFPGREVQIVKGGWYRKYDLGTVCIVVKLTQTHTNTQVLPKRMGWKKGRK